MELREFAERVLFATTLEEKLLRPADITLSGAGHWTTSISPRCHVSGVVTFNQATHYASYSFGYELCSYAWYEVDSPALSSRVQDVTFGDWFGFQSTSLKITW